MEGRPAGFVVLSGDDALTLNILEMGGDGVVSVAANVAPAEVAAMTHAALRGDLEAARGLGGRLQVLFEALFIETNPIPVKGAMAAMGLCGATTRSPLTDAAAETREAVRQALVTSGLWETNDQEGT
jgi:4-hydroxy-tetrahydrodipicolinate synthase